MDGVGLMRTARIFYVLCMSSGPFRHGSSTHREFLFYEIGLHLRINHFHQLGELLWTATAKIAISVESMTKGRIFAFFTVAGQ